MLLTLLAAASSGSEDTIVWLVLTMIVLGVTFGIVYVKERQRRIEVEGHLGNAITQRKAEDQAMQRDNIMFTQHKQMNDLQIAKLTAEVELLQNQVKSKTLDEDRIEASKEYHELMVEKSRLEIDSLRLHLMELRKRARTEDWRSEE